MFASVPPTPSEPFSTGTGVAALLAGRLVLKVTHPNVSVQRRAVVDLKPLYLDVAAQSRVPAEGQLVTRCDHALDVALERHVAAFEECLDGRSGSNVDVAGHPDLALDAPIRVHRPVVDELALEDVARPHRELLLAIPFDFAVLCGRLAFRHRLLNVHASPPTWNLPSATDAESGAKG